MKNRKIYKLKGIFTSAYCLGIKGTFKIVSPFIPHLMLKKTIDQHYVGARIVFVDKQKKHTTFSVATCSEYSARNFKGVISGVSFLGKACYNLFRQKDYFAPILNIQLN